MERHLNSGRTAQALRALDRYLTQLAKDIADLDADGDGIADDPADQSALDELLALYAEAVAIRNAFTWRATT